MSLAPAHNDEAALAELKAGRFNSGGTSHTASPMVSRVMVIAAARFGLTAFEQGKISNVAKAALDAAGGDPQAVDYAGMRPALIKLLGPL